MTKFKLFSGTHGAFTKMIEANFCKIKLYHLTQELFHAPSTRYPSRTINLGVHLEQRKWAKFYGNFLSCELMLLLQLRGLQPYNECFMGCSFSRKVQSYCFIFKKVITQKMKKMCFLFNKKFTSEYSYC